MKVLRRFFDIAQPRHVPAERKHTGMRDTSFCVHDDSDQRDVFTSLIASDEIPLNADEKPRVLAKQFNSTLQLIKSIVPDYAALGAADAVDASLQYAKHLLSHSPALNDRERFIKAVRAYERYQVNINSMDFGDLLVNSVWLLQRFPQIQNVLHRRYKHILVDEFQDLDAVQFELLTLISPSARFESTLQHEHLTDSSKPSLPSSTLFCIGDPHQAIYSFRGGDPRFFDESTLQEHFPNVQTMELNRNYRTPARIYETVTNVLREHATVHEGFGISDVPGDLPMIKHLETSDDEAKWVAEQVKSKLFLESDASIAVFYRNHFIADTNLEAEFAANLGSERYIRYGATMLTERMEVKDVLALLRQA